MGLADDASPLSRRRSYRSGPSHHHAGSATLPVSKSKERQLPVFSLLFLVRSVVLEEKRSIAYTMILIKQFQNVQSERVAL